MTAVKPFSWEYRQIPLAKEEFRIQGGRPLAGRVRVSGAKNAALKVMAAAVLTWERVNLENIPGILDIDVLAETMRDIGVAIERPTPETMSLQAANAE